MNNSGHKKSLP